MHYQDGPGQLTGASPFTQEGRRTPPIILVVEDSEDDFFLLQRVFKKMERQAELVRSESGSEAIKYFSTAKQTPMLMPALLLLDLKLPGASGFEVLKWLRSEPAFKPLVVNVLSSSAEPSDIREAFRSGANAYTVKPMGLNQYDEVITAVFKFWFECCQLPDLQI